MDPTIATILGAILGALLTGPVAYYFTKKLAAIQRFNAAASKIRAAFAPAQAKIRTSGYANGIELRNFFYDEIMAHAAAVEEFRPFASDSHAYQEAWDIYQQTINHSRHTNNGEYLWQSNILETEEGVSRPDFTEIIIQKIDNILHFANPMNE